MKHTLFAKLFSGFLLVILLLTALIVVVSYRTIRHSYINTLAGSLTDCAVALTDRVDELVVQKDGEGLRVLANNMGIRIQKRITVIAPDGTVLADSKEDPAEMENHKTRPEVIEALKGNVGVSLRYSTTLDDRMLYVAVPVRDGNRITAVLRLSIFLDEINSLIHVLRMKILVVSLGAIGLSLLIVYLFSRILLKPITQLLEASHRIASGVFGKKVRIDGAGELSELADAFNLMSEKVNQALLEISQKKEELLHVISAIRAALVVLDRKGRIVQANPSSELIFQRKDLQGSYFWEVCPDSELCEAVKSAIAMKSSISREIRIDNRFYKLNMEYLDEPGEIVLVFHDITEMKQLQKIKRDFVMNVSHELRTPLTAIKGYAETIEGLDGENAEYLEIVKRHTERLINIVHDLLTLSELEERGGDLDLEKVRLQNIVEGVVKIFESRLKQKNLQLSFEPENEIPVIKADPLKMEQVFVNLIDNAIKYTESGKIDIKMRSTENSVYITVCDTGIGIPEKHLGRIFERFYTVDKSHSRRLGGTGLGLSIVKHIILLHNGTIKVKSTPHSGTCFYITIPFA